MGTLANSEKPGEMPQNVTCDFQQCAFSTSEDSDEPEKPPIQLRNSKCCSVCSSTLIKYAKD